MAPMGGVEPPSFVLETKSPPRLTGTKILGRLTGIEPAFSGPQPNVLPLDDSRHTVSLVPVFFPMAIRTQHVALLYFTQNTTY